MLSAFVGSMCGDQLYYYIGRTKGPKFLEKRPHWKPKTDRAFKLLHRYQNLLILCFRFLYGIRIVTPFVIGASGIHPLRYIVLNTIGAVIWAVSFSVLSYTLGESFELLMAEIEQYKQWALIVFFGMAAIAWFYYGWADKRRARNNLIKTSE